MTEVHRKGEVSLHVLEDGSVEVRKPIPHDCTLRFTIADDPTVESLREQSASGLSVNEVCRRYADYADVDFETAAAAVLDELEKSTER